MSMIVALLQQLSGGMAPYTPTLDTSFSISIKDLLYVGGTIGTVIGLHRNNVRHLARMEARIEVMWKWFSNNLERRRVPRDEETR